MKIPYNILIQIKMSVRPYFKGFTLIFFFYNCRKQDIRSVIHAVFFTVCARILHTGHLFSQSFGLCCFHKKTSPGDR